MFIKKLLLNLFIIIIIASSLFTYINNFYSGFNKLKITAQINLENSYNDKNGYWWGFNQNKVASINDVEFTFTYYNSNLVNGNLSNTNPAYCNFFIIVNGIKTKFGEAPANRPCNVLVDNLNEKVYYIVSEPTDEPVQNMFDFTGRAKAVLYTYSFNSLTNEVNLSSVETVIESEETDGAIIRMGTAISKNGDLMIAYGSYNGYIITYIKANNDTKWARYVTLASDEGHSMMYDYAIIENPYKFHILALQDWSHNNNIYYQYAKLYSYEGTSQDVVYQDDAPIISINGYPNYSPTSSNNGWTQTMVIDKRTSEVASAVRTEDFILVDNKIHIVVRDSIEKKLLHYVYENNELSLIKDDFKLFTRMVRIVKYDDKLYYITYKTFLGTIEIIEVETNNIMYRKFLGIDIKNNGNVYVDRFNEYSIHILYIMQEGEVKLYNLENKQDSV